MKKLLLFIPVGGLLFLLFFVSLLPNEFQPSKLDQLKIEYSKQKTPSVDHSQFEILQKPFASVQEVTDACISCHNKRHIEIMKSNHWNWLREEYIEGRGVVYIGKNNVINNFCIGIRGNETKCAKCHIGYGSKENDLHINHADDVDCIVCHERTETYVKGEHTGGAPEPGLDLNKIAQSVGRPNRANCGVCHFYSGGGNNVKHGDLEEAMFEPNHDLDVHMGIEGTNMVCVDCHTTENHIISGKMYSLSSTNRDRTTCEHCHQNTPHDNDILNEHTIKVSCQACHIPTYAKENPTKTHWDWSTAGKLKNGQPYSETDSLGRVTYLSIKGSFVWGDHLKPEYIWFNGNASHYMIGDLVEDTLHPLVLNDLHGSYDDPESKIVPVKVHRATQPYDLETRLLIQPKLYAEKKGEGAFWEDFDMMEASRIGMENLGLPFSGKISFIKTDMYWPINHMVSVKDSAVSCGECHTRNGSRLAGLSDFYMPGRDHSKIIDWIGTMMLILTLVGVLIHGGLRIVTSLREK